MQKRINGKTARYAFDSLAELARYIDTAPNTWGTDESRRAGAGMSWDLNAGFEGAVTMARDGWIDGAQRAQDALKVFNPQSPAPSTHVDFYGHMPHVPRYCAGAPDNMIRHHPQPTIGGGRVLTLYVAVNANGYVKAQCMANFGLGVVQYINQLENDGMRVELYGICASKWYDGSRLINAWRIKSADQPLDLAVTSFSIGHPAMMRRLEFALCERSVVRGKQGYGSTLRVELADLIEPPSGAVILNGMESANTYAPTPEAALKYVTKEIDEAIKQREEETDR